MRLLHTIDLDALDPEMLGKLTLRQAVRAVVLDDQDNVALLHVQQGNYFKIPGGGVEPGEDFMTALTRECLEEIGCRIDVQSELGMTIEYRGRFNCKQESFCYLAYVIGLKGTPAFTVEELNQGFTIRWVPLDEAIRLVSETNTEDYQGKFITPRELIFLQEAQKILKQK